MLALRWWILISRGRTFASPSPVCCLLFAVCCVKVVSAPWNSCGDGQDAHVPGPLYANRETSVLGLLSHAREAFERMDGSGSSEQATYERFGKLAEENDVS